MQVISYGEPSIMNGIIGDPTMMAGRRRCNDCYDFCNDCGNCRFDDCGPFCACDEDDCDCHCEYD